MRFRCSNCGFETHVATNRCASCGIEVGGGNAAADALNYGDLLGGGKYTITQVLGQGGFSLTYLGWDLYLDSPVAIKEFYPVGSRRVEGKVVPGPNWKEGEYELLRQKFLEEGHMLSRFNHPGIVAVYAVFEENDTAYIVMEYLQGHTLLSLMSARGGRLSETEALYYGVRVGEALETVHHGGLLHRDVKPENMLVTEEGRVVLLDFGTARRYLTNQPSTPAATTLTPGYAAPEQYDPRAAEGPPTDVYGLAATLYHLLTGLLPLDAMKRLEGQPLKPITGLNPEVSERVAAYIEGGLELAPDQRPASVRAFMEEVAFRAKQAGTLHGVEFSVVVHTAAVPLKELARFEGHTRAVTCLTYAAGGHFLVSGSDDCTVRLWDPDWGSQQGTLRAATPIQALALTADSQVLATAGNEPWVRVWDFATGKEQGCLAGHQSPVRSLAICVQELLASGANDGVACIYDATTWQLLQKCTGHQGPVGGLAFSPDGRLLATGSDDSTVRLWDTATGRQLAVLDGHRRPVTALAFSPNGLLLASGSNDKTVCLWVVPEQREIRRFRGHSAIVWSVCFSPDGRLLATSSGDKTARLWEVGTAREAARMEGHSSWVRAICFSPDGSRVATASGDKTIRLWEV
ncbi:MAG: serine/threonine-protein kinase, partial [Candidatus Eremiobacterota bacterium]